MYGNSSISANRKLTQGELDSLIFGEKTSEYGFYHFQDPHTQTYFEHVEEEYRLRYKVREAYDGQEFLRRMRADIKREYLTRKKQVKKLQVSAALTFRNAESKLQEYYSETTAAGLPTYRRPIDINAPLVTVVELPHDRHFDLKEYNPKKYFEGLRELHIELRDSARSEIYDRVEKACAQEDEAGEYYSGEHEYDQREAREAEERRRKWEEEELCRQQQQQRQSSSANINDDKDHFSDCGDVGCPVCGWRRQEYEERKQQRECDDNAGDNDGDSDSYDSSYCAEFGYYPREYNYEREIRVAEEARAAAAEQERREENMRDVDGELVDKKDPREITWDKWAASGHVSEKCLGCGDLECSDCNSYGDDHDSDNTPGAEFGHYSREDEYRIQERPAHVPGCVNPNCVACCCDDDYFPEDYRLGEDEEAPRVAQAATQRAEEEAAAEAEDAERKKRWEEMSPRESDRLWFENTRDVNDPWSDDDRSDDHNDNDATEAVTIPEVAAPGKGGVLCAKKKAVAAAGAAKARREKQQRKKDTAKFVPVKITMNTNRENAAAAAEVLYTGRAQVNLPKKRNLNQVVARTQDEARKMKKRDAAKWKRLSTDLKQTAARGTKVATLPDPRPWYNNETYYENHHEYDSDDF